MSKLRWICIWGFSCFAYNPVYAEIYKWVDSNGVTHYGTEKPKSTEAPNVETLTQIKEKPISTELKQVVDGLESEILKDRGNATQLDCPKAVENAYYMIDKMLDSGERNYKGGYIKKRGPHKSRLHFN